MQLINRQWELSNPQYYPDDSAPPVPNMAVTTVEDNSLPFQRSTGYVALHETLGGYRGLTDISNFAGIASTVGYDYSNGRLDATADHLFYTYLNVEATVPHFRVNTQARFDMYFRDVLPAACGLYTVDVPGTGRHVLYTKAIGGNQDKIAYSGLGELYTPEIRTATSQRTTLTNNSLENTVLYPVLDFLLDYKTISAAHTPTVLIEGVNYSIEFRLSRTGIIFILHRPYEDGATFQVTHDFDSRDIDTPVFARFRFDTNTLTTQYYKTDGTSTQINSNFSAGMPSNREFKVNKLVFPSAYSGAEVAMQVIGFDTDQRPALASYRTMVRPKDHYYPLLEYKGDMDMFLPSHTGNVWAYVNQLAATRPFQEIL